jgi:hypothetical protein
MSVLGIPSYLLSCGFLINIFYIYLLCKPDVLTVSSFFHHLNNIRRGEQIGRLGLIGEVIGYQLEH